MISFLIKGLLRDRQRSLFPVLIVTIGVAITVFLHAYLAGVFGDMVDSTARFSSGHVMVMSRAYADNRDQFPNDLALTGTSSLMDSLRQSYPKMTWVQRIHFGGLLDIPDSNGVTTAQAPIAGLGVDLLSTSSQEVDILNMRKVLVRGKLPQNPGELVISDELARRLDVEPGQRATLLSSTMFGGMAMYNFTISGTIRFGMAAMDRSMIIADIADVQQALDMQDASGQILGYLPGFLYDREQAAKICSDFNSRYKDSTDIYAPVMGKLEEIANLTDYLALGEKFSAIIVFIFISVMAIVLWNAGLLGSLRRYGEMGVRLAIGEDKGSLYRSLLLESVAVGLIGSIFGTAVGLLSAYWLQVHGLDISGYIKNINMMFPGIIRARITPATWYIGFLPGLLSTALGTALAGLGVYRRQTASLFKELET